ncbi:putative xyloglucan endotransglucosylase/hydrolase protein 30 [Hibiscus syriacus]|uniref:Xyloglucan endotransglucosylase/hydrolase protein 30 n=1 Tax=Hibiscus syriacus TaxID=106335 RepID=A0A6A3AKH9_HIBSY|nr:putative xyloglucan endotransglucosylase/hydrolase protein 30 [Hibiscus syriacus]
MGGGYLSNPMALYATIWDASSWATGGGKIRVNYDYAPFTAEFRELVLEGCPMDPIQEYPDFTICNDKDSWLESRSYAFLTPKRRAAMQNFKQHYMYYSSCYDVWRYPAKLPGCVIDRIEKERFNESGRLKIDGSHRKQTMTSKARRKRKPLSDA